MSPIPFSKIDIKKEDLASVEEVLLSGWLTHGKYTKLLEEGASALTASKYTTSVSNCTAALHLSVMSQNVGPGDEVIVPAQTHTATAHAVEYCGATAIFADVDPITGNILPSEIEKKINANTKGVIVVHMAGLACEMDEIVNICDNKNLFLIEDCAHALGTHYKGKHVGNFGISGNYSFYPTKQIGIGEGGLLTTNDEKIAHFAKTRKAFGIDTPPEKRTVPGVYDVQGLGYNYRMTDYQAALAWAQLDRYKKGLEQRRKNAKIYCEMFADLSDFVEFPQFDENCSYFIYQLFIKKEYDRNKVLLALKESEIGASIHYATAVPMMTYYKDKYSLTKEMFPNAVDYGARNISLPVHPYITEADISQIKQTLIKIRNSIAGH